MAEKAEFPEERWGKIKDESDRERIEEVIRRDTLITQQVETGIIGRITMSTHIAMGVLSLIFIILAMIFIFVL